MTLKEQNIITKMDNIDTYRQTIMFALKWISIVTILMLAITYRSALYIVGDSVVKSYRFLPTLTEHFMLHQKFLCYNNAKLSITGTSRLSAIDISSSILQNSDRCLSLKSIRNIVHQIPLVANVTVKKIANSNEINIHIAEHETIGAVYLRDGVHLINNEGIAMKADSNIKLNGVISIEHDGRYLDHNINYIEQYVQIYQYLIASKAPMPSRAVFISGRRWNLYLKDGLLIKLPEIGWKDAIDVWIKLYHRLNLIAGDKTLEYIDLRVHGKIFIN